MRGKNRNIYQQHWKDNAILLLIMSGIWAFTGFAFDPEKPSIAIFIFIVGFTLINPLFLFTKQLLNKKQPFKESNTQTVVSFLTLGITIGIIPVFFFFIENQGIFFPAFGLVQGIILLLAGKQIKSASIRITGFLIIINSIRYLDNFTINQLGFEYSTALIILLTSIYTATYNWIKYYIPARANNSKKLLNPDNQ